MSGHLAFSDTFMATLPNTNFENLLNPVVPIIIRSTCSSLANFIIS